MRSAANMSADIGGAFDRPWPCGPYLGTLQKYTLPTGRWAAGGRPFMGRLSLAKAIMTQWLLGVHRLLIYGQCGRGRCAASILHSADSAAPDCSTDR